MTLSQADRRKGFRDEDGPNLEIARHTAKEMGLAPRALEQLENEYLQTYRNWKTEGDALGFLRRAAQSFDVEDWQRDALVDDFLSAATENVLPPQAAVPTREQDETRLAEISDIMRSDRRRYDAQNLFDEAVDIRRRLERPDGNLESADRGTLSVAEDDDTAEAALDAFLGDRFAEMLRDRQSEYWKSPELQAQYRDYIRDHSASSAAPSSSRENGSASGEALAPEAAAPTDSGEAA